MIGARREVTSTLLNSSARSGLRRLCVSWGVAREPLVARAYQHMPAPPAKVGSQTPPFDHRPRANSPGC